MKLLIQATAVCGAFATPVFAQDATTDYATMTCADVLAMDEAGRIAAMDGLRAAMSGGVAGGEAEGAAPTGSDATSVAATGDAMVAEMDAATAGTNADPPMDSASAIADRMDSGELGSTNP